LSRHINVQLVVREEVGIGCGKAVGALDVGGEVRKIVCHSHELLLLRGDRGRGISRVDEFSASSVEEEAKLS
jgi:hypothetical protein